jgi:hypothetical protein
MCCAELSLTRATRCALQIAYFCDKARLGPLPQGCARAVVVSSCGSLWIAHKSVGGTNRSPMKFQRRHGALSRRMSELLSPIAPRVFVFSAITEAAN